MTRWLAAFFLAFGLVSTAAGETPDHAPWDRLLATYVRPVAGAPSRVDYAAWQENVADRAALRAYIAALEATPVSRLTRNEQFAFWVNLYNAATIDVVLARYPVASIREIKPNPFATGPWGEPRVSVAGQRLSLDDIEHRILRKDWREPRVHYALNCASIGCPNLMARAWRAESLSADLDAAARAYVGSARGVAVTAQGLRLSRIYQWFAEDFGDEGALRAHLGAFAPQSARAAIATAPIIGYAYDWSLNDVAR